MTAPDNTFPLDTDYTSPAWLTGSMTSQILTASFQLIWSGANAVNATAVIQGSNVDEDATYNDLPKLDGTSNQITLGASSGSQGWEIASLSFKYLRLKYLKGSNTAGTARLVTYNIARE